MPPMVSGSLSRDALWSGMGGENGENGEYGDDGQLGGGGKFVSTAVGVRAPSPDSVDEG